jgi:TolB-like protein
MDRWIIAILSVAVVLLLTNTFVWKKGAGLSGESDGTPVAEHSIAVLPFVNMSSDKEQEYFSDGISEELLNLLAKIPQLQVSGAHLVVLVQGQGHRDPEIARTLRVAHILEGSVRKPANRCDHGTVDPGGTDKHLWSQTYDRKLDDIFAIQDEIAADVVKHLEVALLGAAPKVRTTDPEAYALYLQAAQLGRQVTARGVSAVRRAVPQVQAIDPSYAPHGTVCRLHLLNEATRGCCPARRGSPKPARRP